MKLPVISGKDFIKLLESIGFIIIRVNGSHHLLKHSDGRITTVPDHKNDPLPGCCWRPRQQPLNFFYFLTKSHWRRRQQQQRN
ncbi:MAG: type II toxin-antitoxin system HicA family toxin [Chitinophagaceae bacterium]|nr:type II toxin-antitoxin system HicA family toxin [Chitinophagaceae bacterium]